MYPSLPYFDRGRIGTPRNLGVGYIFLLLHNLYLKKENKVLEEDAYDTKIISLKKSTRGLTPVIRLCSLFQGRVHAGTLYLYSSKLSTLSTFVKINLSTFVESTVNTLNFYLTNKEGERCSSGWYIWYGLNNYYNFID